MPSSEHIEAFIEWIAATMSDCNIEKVIEHKKKQVKEFQNQVGWYREARKRSKDVHKV